jgi:hypothetical protein
VKMGAGSSVPASTSASSASVWARTGAMPPARVRFW